MKKKLCLLLCAVLCLFPLGACQGEDPAEGALPQPPGLTVTCGEGTAVYDPDNGTLTLTDAALSIPTVGKGIINVPENTPLNIVLVGTNTITGNSTSTPVYAFSDLTISGSGNLTIKTSGEGMIDGISTNSDLTIDGTTVTVTSESACAIVSDRNVIIKDSTVKTQGRLCGFNVLGDMIVSNSTLSASATDTEKNRNAFYIGGALSIENNSFVTAESSYPALFSVGNMGISDSTVKATATGDCGIWSRSSLTITGNSDITAIGSPGTLGAVSSATVTPAQGKEVDIMVGADEAGAVKIENSPFANQVDLSSLDLGSYQYFHSKTVDKTNLPEERSATITANATIPAPTYTVTIPAAVDAGDLTQKAEADADKVKSTTFSVSASSVENLFGAKKVVVSLSTADGAFALKNGDDSLEYAVYNQETGGTALTSGADFTEFTSATSVTGRVDIDQSKITKKGSYTGTMTFTIALNDTVS